MAIIIPWTPLPSAWKATIIKKDMANMAQKMVWERSRSSPAWVTEGSGEKRDIIHFPLKKQAALMDNATSTNILAE